MMDFSIDTMFSLTGDEDCGVTLQCAACPRDSLPVAYYAVLDTTVYRDTSVRIVNNVTGLLEAIGYHFLLHRSGTIPSSL
jgi:hypothetical protein